MWVVALWTWLYASWYISWSHIAQAQVLGTFKEVLGGRQQTQPPVIFRARAEALRFPQGVGRHPRHLTVSSPTQRISNGKKEAAILLRGFLLNGIFRWDGLFCLLVFKKEIHVVNTLLLCSVSVNLCEAATFLYQMLCNSWNDDAVQRKTLLSEWTD